jgi:hypothetical protein
MGSHGGWGAVAVRRILKKSGRNNIPTGKMERFFKKYNLNCIWKLKLKLKLVLCGGYRDENE